jgi:hypothetical protein
MVLRCSLSPLENTVRTLNVTQCFRVTPSTPFVLIVLPLPPTPLTQGEFVASTETHSVQVSSTMEGVSHLLHQPTLHLSWDSLISQPFPNDFKTCRELYRRTTLTEAQTRETTDQVLDESMWEETRPYEVFGAWSPSNRSHPGPDGKNLEYLSGV